MKHAIIDTAIVVVAIMLFPATLFIAGVGTAVMMFTAGMRPRRRGCAS